MANAMTTRRVPREDRFRAVQLLPAPATVLALAVAAGHDVGSAPLGLIAVVGAVATLASALLPMACPRAARHPMPAPTEADRYREPDRYRESARGLESDRGQEDTEHL